MVGWGRQKIGSHSRRRIFGRAGASGISYSWILVANCQTLAESCIREAQIQKTQPEPPSAASAAPLTPKATDYAIERLEAAATATAAANEAAADAGRKRTRLKGRTA